MFFYKAGILCTVGKTILLYDIRCLNDLHAMLKKHGDWMELGSADEQKLAKEGTVEAWGRSEKKACGRVVRPQVRVARALCHYTPRAGGLHAVVNSFGIPTPKEPLMRLTRPLVLGELLMGLLGGPILRLAPKRGVHKPQDHPGFNQWFAAPLTIKYTKRALLSTGRHFLRDNHVSHFQQVNTLDIPKLMVWGRHDRVLSFAYGQQLHGLVPTARWEVFEQSGHLPHFEEPDKFNAMVKEFLKQ